MNLFSFVIALNELLIYKAVLVGKVSQSGDSADYSKTVAAFVGR